jgi:DNA-directed RNA polymerase subunit RPC12/RpoP
MFTVYRCRRCQTPVRRSECIVEPEGLFGPERLCPHCGELVGVKVTVAGWIAALASATLLGAVVWFLQSRP